MVKKGVSNTFFRGSIQCLVMKRGVYYSRGELKRLGVRLSGREIYVERSCTVAAGAKLYSPCRVSGGAAIGGGCVLLPGCVVEGAEVGECCTIGPYCRIRTGCVLGRGCRAGSFTELKNAVLGEGVKAAHLAYIGDAELGAHVNVGCGVAFANYDGKVKRHTYVGEGAFIGCNSVIIAPAHIGAGAYVAAGSCVGGELPASALAISRAPLVVKPGGGEGRDGAGK